MAKLSKAVKMCEGIQPLPHTNCLVSPLLGLRNTWHWSNCSSTIFLGTIPSAGDCSMHP
jgi:hypothetical protein